jgi:hypothetical protein
MITALLSSLVGLAGGVLPDVVQMLKDGQASRHEREFLKLQHELQMQAAQLQASSKLEVAQMAAVAEEIRTTRETMTAIVQAQAQPVGVQWIDGFNAVLRPVTCAMMIALFAFVALGFSDTIPRDMFAPLFLEAVQAVLGFLFGYRTARKLPPSQAWQTTVTAG